MTTTRSKPAGSTPQPTSKPSWPPVSSTSIQSSFMSTRPWPPASRCCGVMLWPMLDVKRLVKPHDIKSRPVTEADLERVRHDAEEMSKLMRTLSVDGTHRGIYALAHSQVDDKDPLAFFVPHVP